MNKNSVAKMKCFVLGCKSSGTSGFVSFPKNDREVQRAWLKRCGRPVEQEVKSNHRICRLHFEPECFDGFGRIKRGKNFQCLN